LNNLIIPTHQHQFNSTTGKIRQQQLNSNRSKYEESEDEDLFDSKNTSYDDLLLEVNSIYYTIILKLLLKYISSY
jgi:hypothetical protein